MYDAIVVGARCAGSATAMLLARAGHRVLLVDRCTFPRDTLSTLYIQQRGAAYLHRWGLLDRVAAVCPALDHVSYEIGDVRLAGCSRPVGGVAAAYAPRRYALDAILADAAVTAGAEFRDRCAVEDLVYDGDRVTGVRLRTRNGHSVAHARLVIGADGMRSTVAEKARASILRQEEPKTCVYYSFWDGASDHFELYEADGQWIGAVPTNDGQTLVQAYFPQADYPRVRRDAMRAYLDNVRTAAPELHERMMAAGRTDRLYGTGDQRNFFRAAAGPGWALVGDAGHHRDSITAKGITHAFVQAQLLTDGVADVIDDEAGLAAALTEYGRRRDEELVEDYHATLSAVRLSVTPHRIELLREVAADPRRTEDFFSAMGGAPPHATPTSGDEPLTQALKWMKRAKRARAVMSHS